ncbi:MAG: hypothetical protein JNL82_17450 [Myxococcales bacterium]|nr:hypothetical protein [Myxococcales bacterium]
MAAEQSESPESFMKDVEASVSKKFLTQMEDLRQQLRDARAAADFEKVCGQKATAEMTARMAEYRRGRWYHVGAVVTSAAAGFAVGYHTQKFADWRPGGVPVAAVAGVPGIIAGARLNESVVTRSVFAVGGAMYILGTSTYVLTHPEGGGQAP